MFSLPNYLPVLPITVKVAKASGQPISGEPLF